MNGEANMVLGIGNLMLGLCVRDVLAVTSEF